MFWRLVRALAGPHKTPKHILEDALSRAFSPEQFDYIVSVAALHHMPMEAILLKMKKALAKGGTLAVLDIYKARFSDLFVNLVAIPANLFMQRVKNGRRPRHRLRPELP